LSNSFIAVWYLEKPLNEISFNFKTSEENPVSCLEREPALQAIKTFSVKLFHAPQERHLPSYWTDFHNHTAETKTLFFAFSFLY
jgi:hypothetical protein